jgi:integrase
VQRAIRRSSSPSVSGSTVTEVPHPLPDHSTADEGSPSNRGETDEDIDSDIDVDGCDEEADDMASNDGSPREGPKRKREEDEASAPRGDDEGKTDLPPLLRRGFVRIELGADPPKPASKTKALSKGNRKRKDLEARDIEGIEAPDLELKNSKSWEKLEKRYIEETNNRTMPTEERAFPRSTQTSHVQSSLQVLRGVMIIISGSTDFVAFLTFMKSAEFEVMLQISRALTYMCHRANWSKGTSTKMLCILRKILEAEGVPTTRVRQLRMFVKPLIDEPMLGRKFCRLTKSDPRRKLLESWIQTIQSKTKNVTAQSVNVVLHFFTNKCLPAFGLTLEDWTPENVQKAIEDNLTMELVAKICGDKTTSGQKAAWVQMFLSHIAGTTFVLSSADLRGFYNKSEARTKLIHREEDGSDLHRISRDGLQAIFEEAEKDNLHKLMYMIMVTTAMRIGGLARIRLTGVATLHEGKWKVKTSGRTREKGGIIKCFDIHPSVSTMMDGWIRFRRPAESSPYLFPGRTGGHISTVHIRNMFGKWCTMAKLEGREYHPHAVRHSIAHIFKDLGNDLAFIKKYLGHKSMHTTEKYYLPESAVEASANANLDWNHKPKVSPAETFQEVVPPFLRALFAKKEEARERKQRETADDRHRVFDAVLFTSGVEDGGSRSK